MCVNVYREGIHECYCLLLHDRLAYHTLHYCNRPLFQTLSTQNHIARYCTTNPPRACLLHVSRSGPTSSLVPWHKSCFISSASPMT
jgi:hypothetical protein